jgi:hypothetical protein
MPVVQVQDRLLTRAALFGKSECVGHSKKSNYATPAFTAAPMIEISSGVGITSK